jgi:membrane fusion protein, multidrug efflux system
MRRMLGACKSCGVGTVLFLLSAVLLMGCKPKEQKQPKPVPEVQVVTVKAASVPATFSFVAQTVSSHQVEIVARVSGFLEKIQYTEGKLVHAGDVLFQIDPKPFEAQIQAARAAVEANASRLWTAKANYDRVKPLAEQKAASMSDLDNATGSVKAAEAGLHGAEANLDKARLDLGYSTIKSPVTGFTGQALIQEGAFVSASSSSAKLTYVAVLDPIWVEFSVSQNLMASVQEQIKNGMLIAPVDKKYPVELELSDGVRYPHAGFLNFADPSFSKDTGTFLMRAEIANPDTALQPGMFVKAVLGGMTRPNVLAVPQKAVQQTTNGHIVYVVNDKGVAELRPVMVGEWTGQDWIINQGIKDGDQVIVAGFQRLGPGGMAVKIVASAPAVSSGVAQVVSQPKQ